MDIYDDLLRQAIAPFIDQAITPMNLEMIKRVVVNVQQSFLAEHPDFVAAYDPRVVSNGHSVSVDAPILSYTEKLETDWRDRENTRLLAELEAKINTDLATTARRYANMMRQHRRLTHRYGHLIPTSTRSIWGSLTESQQYAILKDIDYAVRHAHHD
jgi:hypothetical protein